MSEPWIKMRIDLADDPAVIGIASALGLDTFAVVGRLHKVWGWFDKQSSDGHAWGVTFVWLDAYVSCPGFGEQLQRAGWVTQVSREGRDGLKMEGFEKHNGDSAKKRAQSARRKAVERERRKKGAAERDENATDGSELSREQRDVGVTKSVTRGEEIRGEEDREAGASLPPPPGRGDGEEVGGDDRARIFGALAEACGWDAGALTATERGRLNAAAKELVALGVSAGEVPRRAAVYRRRFAGMVVTPQGLAGNWSALDPAALEREASSDGRRALTSAEMGGAA
ncbi:MAG: hypothetical protein AAGI68_11820 [Planctomycetota bacterium]